LRQEPSQFDVDTRLVFCQPGKCDMSTLVRLGIPSGTVSDQGLCCMESCQVRIAGRVLGDTAE
jgi:hypothetical protein